MLSNYTKIVLMTVVGLFANMLIAQNGHEVHKPNSDKYDQFIEEVYGDQADELVFSKPLRYKSIKKMLNERVEFIQYSKSPGQNHFTNITEVGMFDEYKSVSEDLIFDPTTFNILKYDIDFYKLHEEQRFLFKDTNFVIVILPQL
ncbi:MAG: hypothetical protein ABR595_05120 [Psychroflexus sp.]